MILSAPGRPCSSCLNSLSAKVPFGTLFPDFATLLKQQGSAKKAESVKGF